MEAEAKTIQYSPTISIGTAAARRWCKNAPPSGYGLLNRDQLAENRRIDTVTAGDRRSPGTRPLLDTRSVAGRWLLGGCNQGSSTLNQK